MVLSSRLTPGDNPGDNGGGNAGDSNESAAQPQKAASNADANASPAAEPQEIRAGGGKRLDWLDIAKGIAIMLVIIGHTVDKPSLERTLIFSFHMPLFFILAGFTFKPKPWKNLLVTSAARLLIPYMLVSFIWSIMSELAYGGEIFTLEFFGNWATDALYGSGSYLMFSGHSIGAIWFLLALFVSRVAFNAIVKAFERFNVCVPLQAAIMAMLAWAGVSWYPAFGVLPLDLDVCAYGLMLMWCGYAFAKHGLAGLLKKWYLGIAAGALWVVCANNSSLEIAMRVYDPCWLATTGAVAGTFFTCWISHGIACIKRVPVLGLVERYLAFCGRNSMAIYCLHSIGWLVPWRDAAPIEQIGFERIQSSIVQIFCESSLAYVFKKA